MKSRLFVSAFVMVAFSTAAHADRARTLCLSVLAGEVLDTRLLDFAPNQVPQCGPLETQLQLMEVMPPSVSAAPSVPKQKHTATISPAGQLIAVDGIGVIPGMQSGPNSFSAVCGAGNCWLPQQGMRTSMGVFTLPINSQVWNPTQALSCNATPANTALTVSDKESVGGGNPANVKVEIDSVNGAVATPTDAFFDITCEGI